MEVKSHDFSGVLSSLAVYFNALHRHNPDEMRRVWHPACRLMRPSGDGGIVDIYEQTVEGPRDEFVVKLLTRWSKTYASVSNPNPSPPQTRSQSNEAQKVSDTGSKVILPSDARATTMSKDLAILGFTSGAQQTAFDVYLNNGTVHEESEVVGEEWGKDPVTTEAGIARRKAKTGDSMPELLTAGNAIGVIDLMTSLVREYTSRGKTAEASAITTFQTSMMEVFGADNKAMIEYMKAYRRKYRGRGFPVDLDTALVVKGLKSTDAGSLVSSVKQEADALKKQVEALVSTVSTMKSRIDRVESKVNSTKPAGKGPPADYKCGKCGVIGDHWASKCPLKKEPKEDDESKD